MSESSARRRYIHITQSTADGVTRTHVHIKQLEATCSKEHHEDCFHPELACDTGELALIEELRAYLRPSEAPTRLIARLEAILDSYCDDE